MIYRDKLFKILKFYLKVLDLLRRFFATPAIHLNNIFVPPFISTPTWLLGNDLWELIVPNFEL